jgi:hypothetical protein
MKLSARLVLCLLPACGGGGGADPDAGNHLGDGALAVDARPAAVTIHVFDAARAPVVGRAVAFLRPDDSTVLETTTDSTGTASAPMPDGGSVAIAPSAVAGTVPPVGYTYLGVKNGDELTIGSPKQTSTPFSITVSVPGTAVPTAKNYLFNSSCNINASNETNSLSTPMMLREGCTVADFYVEAKDSSFKTISTAWRPAQAVSAGATVDSGPTFTAPISSTLSVSHAPQFTTITPALDLVVGAFYPVPVGFIADLTLTNGAGTRTLTHASIPGSSLETRVAISGSGSQLLVERATAPTTVALDFTTANLPAIASGVMYSAASSIVTWQESGHAVDTAAADLQVRSGTTRNFRWLIVGPHINASLHVPHLPTSLAAFNVAAGDTATVLAAAIGSFPGGYDRIRAHAFVNGLDFFSPFQGGDRRNVFGYVVADGDTAMIATNR